MFWKVCMRLGLMLASFAVVGCGFVDVSALRAGVSKTGILLIGSAQVIDDPSVSQVLLHAPNNMTVIAEVRPSRPGDTAAMIARAHASVVIIDEPTTSEQQMALSMTGIHFVFLTTGVSGLTGTNVTWVQAQASVSASSVGGYIAGTLASSRQTVAIMGPVAPVPAMTAVTSAVLSGIHASLSTSSAQYIASGVTTPTAPSAPHVAVVLLEPGSQFGASSSLLDGRTPVIDASGTGYRGTAVVAAIPHVAWIDASLADVFAAVTHLPALLTVPVSGAYEFASNSSWQAMPAIVKYAGLVQSGTVKPAAFVAKLPSLVVLHRLGMVAIPSGAGQTVTGQVYRAGR